MSINATFYNFNKRKNSTAIPTGAGDIVAVDLKSGVDILNPSFIIAQTNMPTWNYLSFEGRYYFITDVTSVRNGLWEISASVDVLGTYKSNILSSSALILYATNGNASIADTRIPISPNPTYAANSVLLVNNIFEGVPGSYIATITGKDSVGSYVLTKANLGGLIFSLDDIWQDFGYDSLADIPQAIVQMGKQIIGAGSVSENIRDCRWIPFSIAPDSYEDLYIGAYFDSGVSGGVINQNLQINHNSIDIPWQFNDWRNTSPYTEVYLYIPFIGVVNYPASILKGVNTIDFLISINKITGSMSIEVKAGSIVLGTYSAETAIPIPIGSSNINPAAAIGGISAAAAAGGMALAGAMSGGAALAAIAGGTVAAINPLSQTAGSVGGGAGAGLDLDIICYTVCHNITSTPDNMKDIKGLPLGVCDSLANYTGYIQTQDFSVAGNMTSTEKDMINDLMDGGVYLE